METGNLKSTRGGVQLALAWDVPAVEPRGIIQIVHGMCEHKERYFPLMEFLRDKGFLVVAHDHHGLLSGQQTHYLADVVLESGV